MAVDFDALTLGPCIAAFSESVNYRPIADPAFDVKAIFMDGWEPLIVDQGAPVTIQRPMIGIRLADMGEIIPRQKDRVAIRGKEYAVREVRLDDVGHAKLMLNLLNPDL